MKGDAIRYEMNGVAEAPGKTWFWELDAAVVEAGRCVQCGTCVAVCPSNSIGVSRSSGLPELVKMCTGCSLCWDFCPRGGLRYEALWPPSTPEDAAESRAGSAPAGAGGGVGAGAKLTGGPPGDGLGAVVGQYAARASTVAARAQDGGVVSALLLALLAAGDIDGALVSVPSSEPDEPWKGIPAVVTTPDGVLAASGSFYNQTMALAELDLAATGLPPRPRLAVVGTPCEIQGLRALQARRWPGGTGAHRVDAVVLAVALLCTKSFDYEALMLRELRERRGVDLEQVTKVDVVAGRMLVEYRDGRLVVDEPVRDFHTAALKGCDECGDFVGRCADLSVGSVGSPAGWSSVLVRTEAGRRAFERAGRQLEVRALDDPGALRRLDALDKRTAERSLGRPLDPDGPLFVDYAEQLALGADRAGAAVAPRR